MDIMDHFNLKDDGKTRDILIDMIINSNWIINLCKIPFSSDINFLIDDIFALYRNKKLTNNELLYRYKIVLKSLDKLRGEIMGQGKKIIAQGIEGDDMIIVCGYNCIYLFSSAIRHALNFIIGTEERPDVYGLLCMSAKHLSEYIYPGKDPYIFYNEQENLNERIIERHIG